MKVRLSNDLILDCVVDIDSERDHEPCFKFVPASNGWDIAIENIFNEIDITPHISIVVKRIANMVILSGVWFEWNHKDGDFDKIEDVVFISNGGFCHKIDDSIFMA